MVRKFSFEKLDVWQKSKNLTVQLYKVTENFPDEEKYGLISQMRRAAISIASNIAEGSSRTGNRDQARFYVQAYSSAIELLNQLIISHELNFLQNDQYMKLREEIETITRMLNSLHQSITK